MGFQDFYGNSETVGRAREMLAAERFPHAVLLAGPRGAGKYTLAQMLAKAMNCLAPPPGLPDFCGHCATCLRIAQADDLDARRPVEIVHGEIVEAVRTRLLRSAKTA